MSYPPRSLPPRPYGSRPPMQPYYGGAPGYGAAPAASPLASALGALGGTLGCLLCLSAIGALGLFSCVVALTTYTKQFLDGFKSTYGISGAENIQFGLMLLVFSLILTVFCRRQ